MKFILLILIQLYWKFIPVHKRNTCIFSESCSRYVYRISIEKGFFAGILAFKKRYSQCRPGYEIYFENDEFKMRCVDGSTHDQKNISLQILNDYI